MLTNIIFRLDISESRSTHNEMTVPKADEMRTKPNLKRKSDRIGCQDFMKDAASLGAYQFNTSG